MKRQSASCRDVRLGALIFLFGGCSQILGIDDLKDRLPDAAAASERPSASGAIMAADAAAKPHDAGSPVRDAQPAAAMETGKPIRGTFIDELRQPVAGAEVQIAGQRTQTDAMGRFSFDNVGSMYDATFTLHTSDSSGHACTSIWHYEGVSRREPRFQYGAAPTDREGTIHVSVRAPSFPMPDGTELKLALGSEKTALSWIGIRGSESDIPARWSGDDAIADVAAHALLMRLVSAQPDYLAHQERWIMPVIRAR